MRAQERVAGPRRDASLRGIEWPAFVSPPMAQVLALAWQLDRTQWWTADRLREHQDRQLAQLLAHVPTVPHYRDALGDQAPAWSDVPILSRDALIDAGDRMLSTRYPAHHGNVTEVLTSRTSGQAVRVRSTEVVTAKWSAITLRDHAWHRRDLDARLATIRYTGGTARPPDGVRSAGWGPATTELAPEAPLSVLDVASTTDEQVAWLVREAPAYVLAYPTVIEAIALRIDERGIELPSLREVRTVSEALSSDTRALCERVLGVPLVDMYSAQEVGYIALQCPDHPHYHVQAESVLVEILADDGTPCRDGEIGRVVVTDLHNFATPLLRYELGDYAEVGGACPCGRGLPVLRRIAGRRRGMLRYPDGRTMWPVFTMACRAAARYREVQLVQDTVHALRLRVVPDGELAAGAPAALIAALQRALGGFQIAIEVVDRLDRGPTGKLEEFVSHVDGDRRDPV